MSNRIDALDGLRAIAVAVVVIFHAYGESFLVGGHVGVDIFFVISGFIITRQLLDEHSRSGQISIKNFYRRRIRRIVPAFAVLLIVVFVLATLRSNEVYQYRSIISALSIMNWVRAYNFDTGGFLAHTWSLSIEEQFYLIWPILLICLLTQRTFVVVRVVFALVAIAVIWRALLFWNGADPVRTYSGLDTRADALLIGSLLSMLSIGHEKRLGLLSVWMAGLILAAVAITLPWDSPILHFGGFTIISMCAAVLVLTTCDPEGSLRWMGSRGLVWMGRRSYSLYLWHFPLIYFMNAAFYRLSDNVPDMLAHPWMFQTLAIATSVIAAHLSFRFVERPFLRK